jgi:hypothetical protein
VLLCSGCIRGVGLREALFISVGFRLVIAVGSLHLNLYQESLADLFQFSRFGLANMIAMKIDVYFFSCISTNGSKV